jgi:hypothetical protein
MLAILLINFEAVDTQPRFGKTIGKRGSCKLENFSEIRCSHFRKYLTYSLTPPEVHHVLKSNLQPPMRWRFPHVVLNAKWCEKSAHSPGSFTQGP